MKSDQQSESTPFGEKNHPRGDGLVDPVRWFNQLCSLFEKAAASTGGVIKRYFQVDQLTIGLHFAGSEMVQQMWPALEHIAVDPTSSPDLTVFIWDSLSTETTMPPPPWSIDAYKKRGHIAGFNDGRIFTNVDTGLSLLRMLDVERKIGLFWGRDVGQIPQHESGAPLRTILSWWMDLLGYQLFHCAAIGTAVGGALLIGQGGSGKSTTALLCLASGFHYAGDDFCVIAGRPHPTAYTLYNSAKISRDNLHRLPPHLRHATADGRYPEEEKSLIFGYHTFPKQLATAFPVRVILLPNIHGSINTTIRPASPAAALRALAPSSLFLRPDSGQRAFREMAELVKVVPAFHLDLGSDLAQIPLAVSNLLLEETT